ncbi:metal-sulfur cluster assembly factor [Candidatus Roizmanbacteria bacterium]|nr:metal-sulfur cluster assembly factor [Candidatus Roizmanbacteria bacterium]
MKISEKRVREKLSEVLDPELNISIVDLGLVYEVKVLKNNGIYLKMTLTTIGCPLFSLIEQEVKSKLRELGIANDKIKIALTFDPPWSMERMSERAKAMLGM